ncbi:radical SAM protein [Pectinatus cerevisiiphilus]|uniref:Nitrogen fixation protein NifB n=1 Tax=Pectinatus cerevisiiphilus TaxID=86956 RepID=A0A4R3K410_9FIRM|nr:radical SAM protein [Pectinatus cerevisiiphilus]TCS77478.1 nitrogen fixation protein NifB [Pectinatus cerevisiiphilus]
MRKEAVYNLHPCFGARNNRGRMHLPVCPGCNIFCRFCERSINKDENRPGVAAKVITPQAACDYVERALVFCPDITVVGIAGPGDTLATDNAIETFKLVGKKFPNLLKCMSTNGLLLKEKLPDLLAVGIDTLTVTVNAIDPYIEAQLNDGIIYHGKKIMGAEGAEILIHNQLAGIEAAAAAGITIKINTVLVNEINRFHIKDVAKAVAKCGAIIYNIIPLIPQHKLKDFSAPNCADIESVRHEAGKYIDVFRHCQHCRADAVGIPGKNNFSRQVYLGEMQQRETFSHG